MEKEYIIYSNKYSLHERKTKLNGTVYDVYFRVWDKDNNSIQKKLSGFKTKTEAKQRYNRFVQDHCEFVYDRPKKKTEETPSEATEKTIKELIHEYLSTLGNTNKGSTIYDKENTYNLYVIPYFGDCKPSELTRIMLYDWQEKVWSTKKPRTGEYYCHKYLAKNRTHFSAFLTWLHNKYGYTNYLEDIPVPKNQTQPRQMDIWTVEDFRKFIDTVDDPTYHALFTFAFFTGRRKGELFALTPEDVNSRTIRWNKSLTRKTNDNMAYRITTTKAVKSSELPYCQAIADELKIYSPGEPFFFGGEKPLAENTVRRYFDAHCKIAGVKRIRFHDLRHSFVSMLIHEGANVAVIADLISDTIEQVQKTYAHMYLSDRDEALRKLPRCYHK